MASFISGGAGSLTKSGNGTLIITGANAFTGSVNINAGTLQLSGSSAAIGSAQTGTTLLNLRQGATLDLNAAGPLAAELLALRGRDLAVDAVVGGFAGLGAVHIIDDDRPTIVPSAVEVAEGDGPVNALDGALRSALAKSFPKIRALTLTDYKVRILDGNAATAARTRSAAWSVRFLVQPVGDEGVVHRRHRAAQLERCVICANVRSGRAARA